RDLNGKDLASSPDDSNRHKLLENHGLYRQLTGLPLHWTEHRPGPNSRRPPTNRTRIYSGDNRTLLIRLPAARNLQDKRRTDSPILEERCNAGRNKGRAIHCTRSLATRHDPVKGRDHLDGTRSSVHFHNTSRSYAIQRSEERRVG